MSNIIISGAENQAIVSMFPGADLGRITIGIYEAISQSFEEQKMRNPTREEVKRRFGICINWAKTLRGDLKWGLDRIVDTMGDVLRTELMGTKFEPDNRSCWIPSDGR